MNPLLIGRVLWKRRRLRAVSTLRREALMDQQARALQALRAHAYRASPFYRRFHAGLENAPLEALPVLTKGALMEAFDALVTDRRVRLAQVRQHLEHLQGDPLFEGRYRVVRTSGSTGQPGIFLSSAAEWSTILASYARSQEWAGIHAGLARRTRLAVVSSRSPWHQSARVGLSVDSPILPARRFDAVQPLEEIVEGLNAWQPENLVVYASMGRVLAEEQLAGRLRIRPRAVMCASEVLTDTTRGRITAAWGAPPFNVYGATEAATIASECAHHRLHLFEDLVITESVDAHDRAVPPGTYGAKVLITVLFSRTQPLIRYELSDSIAVSSERCPCGSPLTTLEGIRGRAEDVLRMPARGGGAVPIHPVLFHQLLEPRGLAEWQVTQEPERLRIVVVGGGDSLAGLEGQVEAALVRAGARPSDVVVERADRVERNALGKAPLVRALRPPTN